MRALLNAAPLSIVLGSIALALAGVSGWGWVLAIGIYTLSWIRTREVEFKDKEK